MKNPKRLTLANTITIVPTAPFDFDSTFHKPDHFTTGDNVWELGIKWQTWNVDKQNLGIKFVNKGTRIDPKITMAIYSASQLSGSFLDQLSTEVIYRYNLKLDLTDFYEQSEKDSVLSPIIKRLEGMRPGHPSSLYEYLIIGIMLQNASIRRSIQMFKNLLEQYGTPVEFDGKQLWSFWDIGRLQEVSEDELRALKVGYRAKSIKKVDDQFAQGLLDEMKLRKEAREVQMAELLKLYGVGPATVWYLLFDVFHHWDFFNHISPWEQKIYSKVFFDVDPETPVPVEKLLKLFDKYGSYKQLAVHYIWEDLWWRRKTESIPWLEKQIRV